jgi:histidinol-phosphate aminotransferase
LQNHFIMSTNRRLWLKQSSLALAGITLANKPLAAFNKECASLPADDLIRLTSNENPYGPSPMARKAMADAIVRSNRYPWDDTARLREKIGKRFNLSKEHVIIGAGSSEILGLMGQYVARDKGHFVAPDNTFRIWRRAALDSGATMTRTDLTTDKKFDLTAMEKAVTGNTRLLYVCNPNNPTGTIVDATALKNFVTEMSKKYMLAIDEAYLEYSNQPSMADFVSSNKNVVVIKTFSKLFGLAGARIGYALAHPDTITLLNNMQPWPNAGASAAAVAAASASLDDTNFFSMVVQKNQTEKNKLYSLYQSLNMPYIESQTNFVYYSVAAYNGEWQKELEKRNLLCGGIVEEKEKWTRITVGTDAEMAVYAKAVKEILA